MKAMPLNLILAARRQRQLVANLAIVTGLVMLTAWLYAPTRHFEFVNWDDPWYVLQNPLIQSWSLANLKSIVTESVIRNYAPLTIFSLLVEYTLWGDWAGGYHLVNGLLHATNAILVFFLLSQVTRRKDLAAVTAVLFVVHPVQVESVAWISSQKGLLSAVFILGSLLCWLREDRQPKHEAWGIFLLILALLCKAIAVVVPVIVLCYDLLVRRSKVSDAIVRQIIPGFLSLWLLLMTMTAQVTILGGVRSHFELNRFEILAVDLVILWRYVGMLLCPRNLSVLYDPQITGIWHLVLLSGVGWAAAGWWLWSKRTSQPLVFVAAVSWFALLIPVLNLFPITTLMNDRYLYLPSIPALALLVAGVGWVLGRIRERTTSRLAFAVGGILFLLITAGYVQGTRDYLPAWRNDSALWAHAVRHTPQLAVVQFQRALSLYNSGETESAFKTLDYALTHCNPDELDRKRMRARREAWLKDAGNESASR